MQNSERPPLLVSLRHRTAMACALLALGMLTVWLLTEAHGRHRLAQQTDSLGNTLANQTALLATELVLSNDLISLNVLLTELTRSSAISRAAVFTVDDRMLAMAGPTASETAATATGSRYVAPIALQDSVAGYVGISLEPQRGSPTGTLLFWIIPAAMLLLISLAATLMTLLQRPRTVAEKSAATVSADGDDQLGTARLPASAVLHLWLQGPEQDSESVHQAFEAMLEEAAGLYHARRVSPGDPERLELHFNRDDRANELAYNALCCGVLVQAMNNRINRQRPEARRMSVSAALHCVSEDPESAGLAGLEEAARIAALIATRCPENGLLASEAVLELAEADNHFRSEWYEQLVDLLDGEPYELHLVRAPAGPTRALLQRQASLLRRESTDGTGGTD